MKNKYLLVILFIVFVAFSIETAGIKFGNSRLADSTGYITTNRPFMVNGNLNFTGSLLQNGAAYSSSGIDTSKYYNIYRLDTSKIGFENQANTFTKYNTFDSLISTRIIISGDGFYLPDATGITWRTSPQMSITAQINELVFKTHKYSYFTEYGWRISEVDSTTGIYCSRGMDIDGNANVDGNVTIGGFTTLGTSGGAFKQKLIKGKTGTGTNTNYQFAHGLDFKTIVDFSVIMRNDSTVGGIQKFAKPNSYYGNYTYYVYLDSLNLNVTLPAASNYISDSMFCTITYRP